LLCNLALGGPDTGGDNDPELPENAAQSIYVPLASTHPLTSQSVQPQHLLLLKRLDRYRTNVSAAHRFQQRCGIGAVGLVALNVRSHVLRRQQLHLMPVRRNGACPVMRAATRLRSRRERVLSARRKRESSCD
jgi:hypothetical protein